MKLSFNLSNINLLNIKGDKQTLILILLLIQEDLMLRIDIAD